MKKNEVFENYQEKPVKSINGWLALLFFLIFIAVTVCLIVFGHIENILAMYIIGYSMLLPLSFIPIGFKVLGPNESYVLLLFGKYIGTLKKEGFFYVNPLAIPFNPSISKFGGSKTGAPFKISLKAMTLDNQKQKVNDLDGNPIEIGVVVIWQIKDTAKATFNVDNYAKFVSIQTDASIRNIARQYPYDMPDDGDDSNGAEKSLRGSSQEIADMLKNDLKERVAIAGIEILEARIAHLAYSQEIAAAMLQRQQAKAVVDARKTIVEGAVGMVELALAELGEKDIVDLDNERKAQMVSNLMVVLCANKDTQPIVNSGSIY